MLDSCLRDHIPDRTCFCAPPALGRSRVFAVLLDPVYRRLLLSLAEGRRVPSVKIPGTTRGGDSVRAELRPARPDRQDQKCRNMASRSPELPRSSGDVCCRRCRRLPACRIGPSAPYPPGIALDRIVCPDKAKRRCETT